MRLVFIEFSDRLSNRFKMEIPQLAAVSRWLRREQEPAMYRDEELGLLLDTRKALEAAIYAYEMVGKLFEIFLSKRLRR